MIRDFTPIVVPKVLPAHPKLLTTVILEPARAMPDHAAMDDVADYAATMGREALEGGLWLPLEASHG